MSLEESFRIDMANLTPWISISRPQSGLCVSSCLNALESLGLPDHCCPALMVMIGRRTKAQYLKRYVRKPEAELLMGPGHGQIVMHVDRSSQKSIEPLIYVDNECQSNKSILSIRPSLSGEYEEFTISYNDRFGPPTQRRLANMLCGRVLAPVSDALCYFAGDLGGSKAVAALLAEHIAESQPAADQPSPVLPCVLVIVETSSRTFDVRIAEAKVLEEIKNVLQQDGVHGEMLDARIKAHYREIRVIGLPREADLDTRCVMLRKRLLSMKNEAAAKRNVYGMRFKRDHTWSFARDLLKRFTTGDSTSFSFALASRTPSFSVTDLGLHLQDALARLPTEVWISHLFIPLLSSAILMSSYPFGSHAFPVQYLYVRLFKGAVEHAINHHIVQAHTREIIMKSLERQLDADFSRLAETWNMRADALHQQRLHELRPYLRRFKSHRTCLCCLLRAPEKTLICGHALCNTCVRIFGKPVSEDKQTFVMDVCALCAENSQEVCFSLVPPTAGIRVLSLDGGGVKGIVQLVYLKHLEGLVSDLRVPIADYFDYVCGTSAGGLVAIGIFLMKWTICESMDKFERLAVQTFSKTSKADWFDRVQNFVVSFLRDCQYNSSAIQASFRSTCGEDIPMFNPLSSDTKVAVTTTTAKETVPRIFANYNGRNRPVSMEYDIVRAQSPTHDAFLSDIACCTSAAPWYFQSHSIPYLDTYQDGGLRWNNPIELAKSEVDFMWPDSSIDFGLSIGTGFKPRSLSTLGSEIQPRVKIRFLTRLYDALMKLIDGESIWTTFYTTVPDHEKRRWHRLNLAIDGVEPPMDDIDAMMKLKVDAGHDCRQSNHIAPILDAMIASMFYFEFDHTPVFTATGYECAGVILCRMRLDDVGRKALHDRLSSSHFMIAGHPVPCLDTVGRQPYFATHIKFGLESLDDPVAITIRGITSSNTTISGLPRSARDLMKAQQLQAPFGRDDHCVREKALPMLPTDKVHWHPRASSVYSSIAGTTL